jgi:hypothetical protein
MLIVEKRPMIGAHDTIFLHLSSTGIKNYRFQVGTLNFVQPAVVAFLQDTYLNTNTTLDLTGATNNIDFSVTSDPPSGAADRFRIVFSLGAPLPISFIGIKAYQQGANIAVEWKVANELNMKNYEVEKSTDGSSFSKVATQSATGNNNIDITYNWLDLTPVAGNNFYRVKGIANSGEVKYSPVVKVTIDKATSGIIVYPNPVINKLINVEFKGMNKGVYQFRVINSLGQVMFTKQLTHAGGSATQMIGLGNLAEGSYQLEIINPDNNRTTRMLFVTK